MSKMDELRKMREARYEAASARAKKDGGAVPKKAATRPSTAAAKPAGKPTGKSAGKPIGTTPDETPASETVLCGHRNMSGRTCTREQGHSAKSHRYS